MIEEVRLLPGALPRSVLLSPFYGVMRHKTKIALGQKYLRSVTLQTTTILQALHGSEIRIVKIRPKWTKMGNIVEVKFLPTDSSQHFHAVFRMQRIGGCLDLWLDPTDASWTCMDGGASR